VLWKPGNLLNPVPVVLVTCADAEGHTNVTTVAWAGTICSEPPMLSISLRPTTLSHTIISHAGEFVVNVPNADLVMAVDYCGVASGKELNKFERTGLVTAPCTKVGAPLIRQCPVNMECQVRQKLDLGSHTMFLAEIVAVHATKAHIDQNGRLALEHAGLISYAHGGYYALGRKLGFYGFSVEKRVGARPPIKRRSK
jgi:flavin reductase (DIM6/NTAB) family NADH-FMN oxidoreductase RutF